MAATLLRRRSLLCFFVDSDYDDENLILHSTQAAQYVNLHTPLIPAGCSGGTYKSVASHPTFTQLERRSHLFNCFDRLVFCTLRDEKTYVATALRPPATNDLHAGIERRSVILTLEGDSAGDPTASQKSFGSCPAGRLVHGFGPDG